MAKRVIGMVKISSALTVFLILFTGIFVVIWLNNPGGNWEPWATLVSAVLIPLIHVFKGSVNSLFDPIQITKSKHDCKVFESIDQLLEEDFVFDFCNEVGTGAFKVENMFKLNHFVNEMTKPGFTFIQESIEIERSNLLATAQRLYHFLWYNFDSVQNSPLNIAKICRPEDNPHANRGEYEDLNFNELYDMLAQKIDEVKTAYSDYRIQVKNRLYV